jgi:hypothetical protein
MDERRSSRAIHEICFYLPGRESASSAVARSLRKTSKIGLQTWDGSNSKGVKVTLFGCPRIYFRPNQAYFAIAGPKIGAWCADFATFRDSIRL